MDFIYLRTKITYCFLGAVAICALPSSSLAEGWLQPKGETLAIYDVSHFTTNDFHDENGDRVELNGRFTKIAAQSYIEHGFRDWVTLIAVAEVSRSRQTSALNIGEFDVQSLGLDVGARFPLTSFENGVLSSRVLLSLPEQHSGNNAAADFREELDAEVGLEAGYNFPLWGRNHYVSGSVAYRRRGGVESNQWVLHAIAGLKVNDALEILPELDYQGKAQGSLANSQLQQIAGQNDFKQLRASLSALWHLNDDYSLQVGGTAPIYSRSTGAGLTGKVGLWHRF